MSNKILNIEIDKKGLFFFNNNKEKIVVVRPYAVDIHLKIACVSFQPFPGKNSIEFLNNWSMYASPQPITEMDEIRMQAIESNIQIGKSYVFKNIGFDGLDPRHLANRYGFSNKQTRNGLITCGLAQKINVNNKTCLSVTCVASTPFNQVTYFQPDSIIWIFAAKGILPNMVIPSSMLQPNENQSKNKFISMGSYLEIDLNDTTTVYFDDETNLFEKGTLSQG